jgi:hypothetical protein
MDFFEWMAGLRAGRLIQKSRLERPSPTAALLKSIIAAVGDQACPNYQGGSGLGRALRSPAREAGGILQPMIAPASRAGENLIIPFLSHGCEGVKKSNFRSGAAVSDRRNC